MNHESIQFFYLFQCKINKYKYIIYHTIKRPNPMILFALGIAWSVGIISCHFSKPKY
jgi:hypothetical protein